MEFEQVKELLLSDTAKGLNLLNAKKKTDILTHKKEYKGGRTIRQSQVGNRLDKSVGKGADAKTVVVAKIPINYQQKIVRSATSFLFGSPVELISENEAALTIIKNVWDANRLDSKLKQACEMVKSETEAVLFFFEELEMNEEGKEVPVLKIRLYGSDNGTYAPYFDAYGDMKAFTWNFSSSDENGKEVLNAWVFTATETIKFSKLEAGWTLTENKANLYGKIPIVYLSQDLPDWHIVKELIDQNEMTFSKFTDTNSYFAAPIAKIFGKVTSMPDKNEAGKSINIPQTVDATGKIVQGDVQYLTWEQAPEAIRLENEISKDHIYGLTDTPDLSFNNVKGIGVTSGTALRFMFMGAINKAKFSETEYLIAIERIISLIKAGTSKITDLSSANTLKNSPIQINFTSILPDNLSEIIATLSEAVGGKAIMSQETAVRNNPWVENTTLELEAMKKEELQAMGESVEI